ncbi:MAG: T9SS type A sorting domain-containing protein [Flavobacteriales bacterium]|nr:T9SS type A sorting domain-containing protein [Flavobacteriales bacterium]
MKRPLLFTTALFASIAIQALTVTISVVRPSYCGRASGTLIANVSGGVPPYDVQWSNGSTEQYNPGLPPGMYTVVVTDSQLDEATADGEVPLLNSYDYGVNLPPILMHCPGDPMHLAVFTGMNQPGVQPPEDDIYGPNPYSFTGPGLTHLGQSTSCNDPNGVVWELLTFDGVQPGSYQLDYTDANGCPGTFDVVLGGEMTWPDLQVIDVSPSCPNYTTGSFTFACQGTDINSSYSIRWRSDGDPSSCGHLNYSYDLASGTTGQTVSDLEAGDYWLIMSSDALGIFQEGTYSYLECKDSIMVTVPALTEDCGVVTGQLYIDENANCIRNGGENRIPSSIIAITPGPTYVTTSSTGLYTLALPFGDYTFTEQNPTFTQSCPGDVTINAGVTQTLNIGCEGGVPLDVEVAIANGPARPGFELRYGIHLQNLTSASPGTVTLSMEFDPDLTYLNATRTPTSVVGNTITWTAPQLMMNSVFQAIDFRVDFLVASDVGLIGSTLNTSIELTTANPEIDLANNTATSAQLVTGSFDPNDKVATTSSRSSSTQYFIDEDEWIDYTIRFQNTGTDTAFTVIITDTLPNTLDPATVQWGAFSHTGTRSLSGQGLLKFIFPNIMLPDSNSNEAASHGFVSFRIRPRLPLTAGTQITNTANIFFDFNDPVITAPSILTAEFSTGIDEHLSEVKLFPNPAINSIALSGMPNARWTITSMDGRRLASGMFNTEPGSVDVGSLSDGIYLITLFTAQRRYTIPFQKLSRP